MKEFIEFCLNHWTQLLYVVVSVISMIIICAKQYKVKSIDSVFASLLLKLPDFIKEAEVLHPEHNSGKAKLVYVFQCSVKYICKLTNDSESKVTATYGAGIYDAIENILNTPTKKGD